MVAEVTQPSLGVGYEIGRAMENNKKILCLFRPDSGKCKSNVKPAISNNSFRVACTRCTQSELG